ncbi:unnamed protein product, partial [Meganyctiphanes norvegica]
MFLTRSEYDRGVNTFSPEGRLFQVEIRSTKIGSVGVGVSIGVVLQVVKGDSGGLLFPLGLGNAVSLRETSCAVSGLVADSRTLVDHARAESANHWFVYNEDMKVESVAQAVSNLAIKFGDSDDDGPAMSRPFGVAMLFAGIDRTGAQLFHMDPSGTFLQFGAKAIGSGSEGAQQSLQESYHKSMTLQEALKLALTVLKQVMEEKVSGSNVEVAAVTKEKGFHRYPQDQVETIITSL